jgi:dipeptidyl-peptidase 4
MSTTQDYQAAEQLLRRPARPGELVIGDKIKPQWIDGGARFWYAVSTGAGKRFVLVDPAAGTREPAFDHARLAAALAAASGQQVDPEALPFMAIELAGLPHLPPAMAWSPDSTKVLTHRTDERGVRQAHLVEARPADGGAPVLRTQRYASPGTSRCPTPSWSSWTCRRAPWSAHRPSRCSCRSRRRS